MRRILLARVWLRPPVDAARALARAATGTSPRRGARLHSYQGGTAVSDELAAHREKEPSLTAEGSLAGSVPCVPFPLPLGMRSGRRPGTPSTGQRRALAAREGGAPLRSCVRTGDRSPHRGSQSFRPSADGRTVRSPGSPQPRGFCISGVVTPVERRYRRQAVPPLDTGIGAAVGKMPSTRKTCASKG